MHPNRECCVLQTFLGDILSDLPRVSNFAVSDRSTYQSKPKTPMQRFLRRDPPAWAANKYSRAENAVRAMASTQEDMASRIKTLTHLIDPSLAVCACPPFAILSQYPCLPFDRCVAAPASF